MRCPTCRVAEMIEIRVELRGSNVTMHSCSHCETRWWDEEGERVALHHVLRMADPR
jgi:Zn-finger nucleic acid-binding protein